MNRLYSGILKGVLEKTEHASELFNPTGRNVDAEALICLNCPLPECKNNCTRYKEEEKKIRSKQKC